MACCFGGLCNISECSCPPGLSALGDLKLGGDCILDLTAIKALWGITLTFWAINGLFILIITAEMIILSRRPEAAWKLIRGDKRMLLLRLITSICLCLTGGLHVTSSETELYFIGLEPISTIAFSIGVVCFWSDFMLYPILSTSPTLLNLAIDSSKLIAFFFYRLAPVLYMTALFAAISPILIIYVPYVDYHIWIQIHFVTLGILILVIQAVIATTLQIVIQKIRSAIATTNGNINQTTNSTDSRQKQMKAALEKAEVQARRARIIFYQYIMTGPVSIVFGTVPYLIDRLSYFLPVVWFVSAFGTFALLLQLYLRIDLQKKKILRELTEHAGLSKSGDVEDEVKSDDKIMGLGIINFKKKKSKWTQKMSRITEATENSVMQSSQL